MWHVRLHLYIGQRRVPVEKAVADSDEFLMDSKGKVIVEDLVAQLGI